MPPLTEQGVKKVEKFFTIDNLADPENLEIQHNINLDRLQRMRHCVNLHRRV